jgi:hypothetical protein
MGREPKRGGTPGLVDGNIDGKERRIVGALERAQVTGGVDDGDGSRDADGTGRSERRVDEGDCGSRLIEAVAIDLVMGFSSLGHNPFGFLRLDKMFGDRGR